MTGRHFLKTAAFVLVAGALMAAPALAQQMPAFKIEKGPDYSRGKTNPLTVYAPTKVAPPVLTNSPRVDQLIQNGELRLSLQDAISLALENNLDISVQRYTPWLSDLDLLRTKAGSGTAAGTFDPRLTSTFGWQRASNPINNPILAGSTVALPAITNYNAQADMALTQGFHTGTSYAITWNNRRQSTTSPGAIVNPSVSSTLIFGFTQPLLNGFGFVSNMRFIRIARNNKRIADLTFTNQLIVTVSAVQNMYWDLVFAREDVKVKQRSVELAEKLYNDNKRQVEIGTLAPIEVVRAEAEVARTRQDLIVAQTFLLQQQTLLKNAVTKNVMDATLQTIDIVPTDVISKPPTVEAVTLSDAVKEAWEKRPDIRQSQIDLESRSITTRATRNALLPTLNLNGQFSGTGLGGNSKSTVTTGTGTYTSTGVPIVDANGVPVLVGGVPTFGGREITSSTTTVFQGGYSDSLNTLRHFDFPTYGVSLNLTIPILNRAAQADNAQAILLQRQAETSLKRLQNSIIVEVRNAQIALEQNRARVEAAQKSRELAERTLDAEQKKYQLGASTIFFVIQAQRDLAAAQSAEVSSLVALTKSKVDFEKALGRTLEVNNITLADAKNGEVNRQPHIPGTPSSELVGERVNY
ncbi:MAG: TolC family protein [Acidobacteria bacterium]|nr:TolC family protein [Acidobacteriota bacterium]